MLFRSYGASKLAGEGLIQAYEATYGFKGTILRLATQMGPGNPRGHVIDLHRKLKQASANPYSHPLRVMGNGDQYKSYLFIEDCIDAFMYTLSTQGVFNVAGECWAVRQSVELLQSMLGTDVAVEYEGQARGWAGDSPHIEPSTERLRALGWRPRITTREAIVRTIEWLEGR